MGLPVIDIGPVRLGDLITTNAGQTLRVERGRCRSDHCLCNGIALVEVDNSASSKSEAQK